MSANALIMPSSRNWSFILLPWNVVWIERHASKEKRKLDGGWGVVVVVYETFMAFSTFSKSKIILKIKMLKKNKEEQWELRVN